MWLFLQAPVAGSLEPVMPPNDPDDPNDEDDLPQPPQELFPFDEMSTGETSSLIRRAHQITGAPDRPLTNDPSLKPMTGAQLAFRPSAPTKPTTGAFAAFKPASGSTNTQAAFKPGSGNQPAHKPATGTQPAFKPSTGVQPAFTPTTGTQAAVKKSPTGTNQFAAFKPQERPEPEPRDPDDDDVPPVFDPERLQAQIRALSLTDSALGRASKSAARPSKLPSSSAEDTFVKTKMKQAEAKVPDFNLDEDLG